MSPPKCLKLGSDHADSSSEPLQPVNPQAVNATHGSAFLTPALSRNSVAIEKAASVRGASYFVGGYDTPLPESEAPFDWSDFM
jgi:hypothetical protein